MENSSNPISKAQNPLTKSQSLLWIGQEMNPESPMYNMVLTFEFKGKIQTAHFREAFQELIRTSDVLRTVFYTKVGRPLQIVLRELPYKMEILDFSLVSKAEKKYKDWESERTKLIFDLTKCLFDSVLIKFSDSHFLWYFNQHHLTTDAWSTSVIYKRMEELYKLSCEGKLKDASVLPQFQDFIDFEKEVKQNDEVIDHWQKKQQLETNPPLLYSTKTDRSTSESIRVHLDLGVERSEKLRQLGLEKDIRSWTPHLTLYNIFLTTLFAYLYRVSGQRTLTVGSPAHNRPTNDFKNTIGIFIEIFPLFTEISENESFISLLEKVKLESNSFLKYAQPGASLADLNRNFNVFFNYINVTYSDFDGITMNSEWVHPGHSDPRHHLRLQVHDFNGSGAIQLYFDLNQAVFDEEKQAVVPGHFLSLLDAFIKDRQKSIESISLLAQKEYEKIIFNLNDSSIEEDIENRNIITLIEAQADQSPDATALIFKNLSLTYCDLNQKANRLAHYLVERNCGEGAQVAILLKRSPEYVISVLATLKTGATFIPIPSNYPEDRIQYLLDDSDASFLIGSTETLDSHIITSANFVVIDQLDASLAKYPTFNLSLDISPDTTAFLIYTSGSTGKPKGVKVTNRALTNYIKWTEATYINSYSPAIALFTTVGFDITANSVFLPLVCGGTIHVYQETDLEIDLSILDVIDENKVDFVKLTPAHLNFLKGKKYPDSKIKVMVVTGDEFKTELGKQIYRAFDGKLKMYNEYGPAEATIGCIYHEFTPDIDSVGVPIGLPIHNMQAYILDNYKNPVPQGVVGELYLAGVGLADGYWERPELTEEKFVPNPFKPGTKMYRTQDLARLNEEGVLEFLGRTDFQVKLNGHRIELGEIEAQLADYKSINTGIVMLDTRDGLKSLTAYFTADSTVSLSDLQSYLAQKLPNYMLPSRFKQLEAFPLSSNGKIDRKILKTLNTDAVEVKTKYIAPQTEIEEVMAEIWQGVLDIPKIGIHDNFLELGGESLMALRVTSRINETLELSISLDQIFKLPTIAKLSAHIEETIIKLLNSEVPVTK